MQKHLHCSVHGEVQGVFYRTFTKETAKQLNITGSVQNLPDGTVEVIAEGEEAALKALVLALRERHAPARVEYAHETWGEATGEFSAFRIIH